MIFHCFDEQSRFYDTASCPFLGIKETLPFKIVPWVHSNYNPQNI